MSRVAVAALLAALAAAGHAAALDGMRFNVQFSADGKAQDKDVIAFDAGKVACPGIGKEFLFGAAPYTAERAGETMAVAFSLSSAKHGTVAFKGVIARDGAITGTRTWTKPGKDPIEHAFKGAVEATAAKKPSY